MEYKVESKEFPTPTGMVKTVESITIRAINVDRDKDTLNVDFFISLNGFTKDLLGNPQQDLAHQINLSSNFLVRQVKNQLFGQNIDDTNIGELTEEELEEYNSKEIPAKQQIYPLLQGLLVGTWQQAYTAATALASQYDYTLLPIEEQ